MKAILLVLGFLSLTQVHADNSAAKAKGLMALALTKALQSDIDDIRAIVDNSAYFYSSHRYITANHWRGDIVCWEERFKARFQEIHMILQSLQENYRLPEAIKTALKESTDELVNYCEPGEKGGHDKFTVANLKATLDKIEKDAREIPTWVGSAINLTK